MKVGLCACFEAVFYVIGRIVIPVASFGRWRCLPLLSRVSKEETSWGGLVPGSSHSHSHLLHFRWNSGGWGISVSCGCGFGFDIMVFASLLIQAHNERPGVDAGWRLLFASEHPWPGTTQVER